MTPLILDASVAASWFLPDEKNANADAIFRLVRAGSRVLAPTVWAYEVRHTILKALPLASLDGALLKAAARAGIPLFYY